MKAISLWGGSAAGLLAMATAVTYGQMNPSGSTPKVEPVADATGNLHVPDTYRTTYQFLGSWAVAEDKSKEQSAAVARSTEQQSSRPVVLQATRTSDGGDNYVER